MSGEHWSVQANEVWFLMHKSSATSLSELSFCHNLVIIQNLMARLVNVCLHPLVLGYNCLLNLKKERMFYCRCTCKNCVVMPTSQEFVCCQEVEKMNKRIDGTNSVLLNVFYPICVNIWSLQEAYTGTSWSYTTSRHDLQTCSSFRSQLRMDYHYTVLINICSVDDASKPHPKWEAVQSSKRVGLMV